jgi:putative tricarboxylic transport membrane protein
LAASAVLLAGSRAFALASSEVDCIAPAKPGGGFDLTCRLVDKLLKQRPASDVSAVRTQYLPGGIGAVAFDRAVTQHLADPHVVIAFSTGSLVNLAQGKFGPHSAKDVRWLATLGTDYGIVAVRRDSPVVNLAALMALLRYNPDGAVFGGGGTVGSLDWIKAALLVKAAGRDHRAMRFVAFEGGGQALAALKGGHVDVFCGDAAEARAAATAGELKVIAVLAPHRLKPPFAQILTAREQGVDVVWPTVRGLYMGPGVSDRDYADWVRLMRRVMATPQFVRLLGDEGLEPRPMAGPEVQAYASEQVEQLRELARSLHLRVP